MFKKRSEDKEMLDDAILDPAILYKNLKEFSVINKYLGTQRSLINALNTIYEKYSLLDSQKTLRIADLGCGAGDILVIIHLWAKHKNINLDITGIDINPAIIEYTKNTTSKYGGIKVLSLDIFSDT